MTDTNAADEARRTPITVRLRPHAIDRLDTLAHEHSLPGRRVTRSDVIKACLSVALRYEGELGKDLIRLRDGA